MLKHSDLQCFVELVRRAEGASGPIPQGPPETLLRGGALSENLLYRSELSRLRCSLKIASVAGDVPDSAHRILHTIVQNLVGDGQSYLPLTHSKEWVDAIRWAVSDPALLNSNYLPHAGQDRNFVVGSACRALRNSGYAVDIGASGPRIDADTRMRIARQIHSLVGQMGGTYVAAQLCRIVRESGRVHAGMWLLGNVPARIGQKLMPAVPLGWLFSIVLRHIHVKPSVSEPDKVWDCALKLATDFAASTDCQRYNQFDGSSLEAPDFLPSLAESLTWRELFTLPQVPPLVLPILRDAFSQIAWPKGTCALRGTIDGLFGELDRLLKHSNEYSLTEMQRDTACSDFPLLWRHARARQGCVNAKYLDPFGARPRDQDRFVFFEAREDQAVVLPTSLTAAAGCEAIFRQIWGKEGRAGAGDIVGSTIEKAIAIACRAHTAQVWENERYRAEGADLEIDVAVRDDQEIILFESKAKSLTSKSRTGDMMAFIDDYTKSFLALLVQLARHDRNIKRGLTPLNRAVEDAHALRVRKIAVSPLSYGPASDHVLTNALVHAIAAARLNSVDGDPDNKRILGEFNKSIERAMKIIDQVAPRQDGKIDMVRYLMGVSWLDLGQLLYSIHRGRSVTEGLSALSHLTFSTRDFWTEAALADRSELSKGNWHPLRTEKATPD